MSRVYRLLYIEDSPSDAYLVREAVSLSDFKVNLMVVPDGEQALHFLMRQVKYSPNERPDLILLDLNLPKIDGLALLQMIKADEVLKSIPVVVFSTAGAGKACSQAYDVNANCCVTKPLNLSGFLDNIQGILNFWFAVATIPTRTRAAHS